MKQHLSFPTFWGQGKVTNPLQHNHVMIADRTTPYKRTWAGLALRGIKSRVCHSRLGLFNCWIGHNYPVPQLGTLAQSEWGNSHPLHWRQLYWPLCEQLILFPDNNSVSFQMAPPHFILYGIHTEMVVTYMDTLYNIMGCFLNSLRHVILYFNWHTIIQYYTISHMDSLGHGSNSPRVHEQLL